MTTTLKKTHCRECHATTLVVPYMPHPDQTATTGMPASRWDSDRMGDYHVGYICEPCAFARVGEGLPGAISGPELEFHY